MGSPKSTISAITEYSPSPYPVLKLRVFPTIVPKSLSFFGFFYNQDNPDAKTYILTSERALHCMRMTSKYLILEV
jgi:hypothetical protein